MSTSLVSGISPRYKHCPFLYVRISKVDPYVPLSIDDFIRSAQHNSAIVSLRSRHVVRDLPEITTQTCMNCDTKYGPIRPALCITSNSGLPSSSIIRTQSYTIARGPAHFNSHWFRSPLPARLNPELNTGHTLYYRSTGLMHGL